jgi:hypothetical protein
VKAAESGFADRSAERRDQTAALDGAILHLFPMEQTDEIQNDRVMDHSLSD